jgi:predicted TIM-barrel fold metal-dependent hydrolase
MKGNPHMKIDIFPHIMPVKYKDALVRLWTASSEIKKTIIESTPMIYDLDLRFRMMDQHEGLKQVLTLASPALEEVADSEKSVDLARLANDEMAELVTKHPDRFVTAVAALPMNNMDAALKEIDRAISDLKLRGVQVFTPINDRPLDSPDFHSLFEQMSHHGLPIWLHPARTENYADYRTEERSRYGVNAVFGWPYETTVAMTRLVFSGMLEKYPDLKIITHHCGGMVPYFDQRIVALYEKMEAVRGRDPKMSKNPIDYFKKFYNDTALYGSTSGLMCGYAFFGADHLLFGTDMPLGDRTGGQLNTGKTIASIEQMNITQEEKKMIFEDNARRLLGLT